MSEIVEVKPADPYYGGERRSHKGLETWIKSWSETVAHPPPPHLSVHGLRQMARVGDVDSRKALAVAQWDHEVKALADTREVTVRHRRRQPGERSVVRDGMIVREVPEQFMPEQVRRLALALGDYHARSAYTKDVAGLVHKFVDQRLRALRRPPTPQEFVQLALVTALGVAGTIVFQRLDEEGKLREAQVQFADESVCWFSRSAGFL